MMPLARAVLAPLLLVVTALAAETAPGLPKYSPFTQRATAGAAAAAHETVEFAGISTVGSKTDLIFYDKTAKKSHWIGMGETKEGISVLNFDELREQVVVKINGSEKVLSLRKVTGGRTGPQPVATLPTGFNIPAPAAVPAPAVVPPPNSAAVTGVVTSSPPVDPATTNATPAPYAPATPQSVQAKQETEARMLVSDLLEIGMAQRRAYEEAQRKADSGTPQTPPNPADASPAPKT